MSAAARDVASVLEPVSVIASVLGGKWQDCSEVLFIEQRAVCRISAAAGQVILAMDPVISIALGYLVARNETHLGPLGIAGGATLLGACLLASFYAKKEH